QDEYVLGLQYDVGLDMVLGAAYIHRELGTIIEDISPDGTAQNFIIGNPGEAADSDSVKDLQKQILNTNDPMKKMALQQKLALYQGQGSFTKPKRDYNALVLTAQKRLSHNFIMLASYTYARTLGNYPGTYSASNTQLNPHTATQYDIREL